MSTFRGAGVAIVTPFKSDETVDFDALGNLIEFQIENKTDAIIICGTTGEASTLTDEEQIECVRYTVDKVNKRVPVIAGAGSNHTEHGVALTKGCQKAGADAILSVTPYYNKATHNGLLAHYGKIAASVDLPIILYNVPGRTGLAMAPKTVYALSKIPNIVGIKEASGNISAIAQIADLCGSDFELYSGNDDQILPILALGGIGVISVASNIIPLEIHNMVTEFLSGNVKEAIRLQLSYLKLCNALFYEFNPIPVKAALELMGKGTANYRLPMCKMDDTLLKLLELEMKACKLI